MTYWNELSSFFFSCGDGAISSSSTFHAFCDSRLKTVVDEHGYERTHLSDVECGLRGELIPPSAVLMEAVSPTKLYSYAPYISHACNAKVDP